MSKFRLEIHHTTHIGKIPVEVLDLEQARWLALPKWQRITRKSPLMRANKLLTSETEPLDGHYDDLDEAIAAAQAKAVELDGEIRVDSRVAVVGADDGIVRIAFLPGTRGRA